MKEKTLINYEEYAKLLKESLKENGIISEDTARYLFYASVIKNNKLSNKTLTKIHQEVPYSDKRLTSESNASMLRRNSELDSFFDFDEEQYAVEFKYHRETSNKHNKKIIPHTLYAGEIFDDINRLSIINNSINRYFVYLMDKGMINYKEESLFHKVISLKEGERMFIKQKELSQNQPKTFKKEAFSSFKIRNKLSDIEIVMERYIPIEINDNKHLLIVLEIK